MSTKSKQTTSQEMKDILDSDDELPDFYNDTPYLPAYLDNNRFDTIELQWIEQKIDDLNINASDKLVKKPYNVENNYEETQNQMPTNFFLSKRDIYLIKCLEKNSTDSTLLWFIEFLKRKSIDNHNLPTSCLIQDL